jgi:hypothetical protein
MRRRHVAALVLVAAALAAIPATTTAAPVPPPPAVRRGAPPAPPGLSPAAKQKDAALAGVVDASACPPYVSFFPPGSEDLNVPAAWSMANQRQAGNPYHDRLLPVVLTSVSSIPGSPVGTPPTLQIAVSHPLLGQPGTFVGDVACMGVRRSGGGGGGGATAAPSPPAPRSGAITRRRTLLQQAGYLSKPASYSITWSLNGTAPSTRVFDPSSSAAAERPRIMLPELQAMRDGYYCLTMTVTVMPWTGLVGQTQAVPVSPLYVSKRVCFVKADGAVSSSVGFDGCGAPFSMLVGNVSLPAVPLVPGNPNAGVLGVTALRVRASLNRTDDATPVPEGAKKELVKWFLLDRPLPADAVLRYQPADGDADASPVPGWYNVDMAAFLVTNRPGLVALPDDQPSGVFGAYDVTVPPPLRGLPFYSMGVASTNATGELVPLQPGPTRAFTEMIGPDEYLASTNGAQVQFTWKTEGMGPTYCFQSEQGQPAVPRINDDKGRCRSPFDTHVGHVDKNETLSLSFTDACGDMHARLVEFGRFGWRVVREIEPPTRRARPGIDVDVNGSPIDLSAMGAAGAAAGAAAGGRRPGGLGAVGAEFDAFDATHGAAGILSGSGASGSGGLLQAARRGRKGDGGARNGASAAAAGATAAATAAAALAAAAMAVLV